MNSINQRILDDLAVFADLGTEPPTGSEVGSDFAVRLVRNGERMDLVFRAAGQIIEQHNEKERKHANFRALLASDGFADLSTWASRQRILLQERVARDTITVLGHFSLTEKEGDIEYLDDMLVGIGLDSQPRTSITLIDGPAGIGKTSIIRALAFRRADQYRKTQRALILHVESRGRMLQNLTDLMAFSLQTLRLGVTYDQIPTLVRLGLITLCIDGFDELGDPSGYDLAWAQVNQLVADSRGLGTIILAGRETFIGKERMRVALTAVDEKVDQLETFSLQLLSPINAKNWLLKSGWSQHLIDSEAVSPLFEQGSYALRPFFLRELSREEVVSQLEKGGIDDLLSFLVKAMAKREADKFGSDVEAQTTAKNLSRFVERLMEEVARDIAENQASAISSEMLSWLAEVVATDLVPENLVGLLRNRAGVIAFLAEDDRRGYKRFVHEQVSNYFLSRVTVTAVLSGEIPKYVRRNIFGLEFLENFCSVVRFLPGESVEKFLQKATFQIDRLSDHDRSRRNLASMVLTACSVFNPATPPILKDVSLDEVYFSESVSHIELKSVTIAQIYANGADLREVDFDTHCFVASLIADEATIPSPSLPMPGSITLRGRILTDPKEKRLWIANRLLAAEPKQNTTNIIEFLKNFSLFDFLGRVARYKPYWLKDGEERASRRILDDPHWEVLKELMLKHDLLIERHDIQASGRPGAFYHIRNRLNLLNFDHPSQQVRPFFEDMFRESIRLKYNL